MFSGRTTLKFCRVVMVAMIRHKMVRWARTARKAVYIRHMRPKPVDCEERSLFLFAKTNPLRVWMIKFIHNAWFERFIVFAIILNAVLLALTDYSELDRSTGMLRSDGWQNRLNADLEFFFTTVFTIECVCKVVAEGFIMHRNSYLRSGWNMLDFVVVVAARVATRPACADRSPAVGC